MQRVWLKDPQAKQLSLKVVLTQFSLAMQAKAQARTQSNSYFTVKTALTQISASAKIKKPLPAVFSHCTPTY